MTCPYYNPNNRMCGLKSEYYGELSSQTLENYCTSDYLSCDILKSELERKKSEVEKKVHELEDTKKIPAGFMDQIIKVGSEIWKKRMKKIKKQNKGFFDTVITKRRLKPGTLDEEITI